MTSSYMAILLCVRHLFSRHPLIHNNVIFQYPRQKDFWSIRDYIFWGQRTCILTSEKSVSDVLKNGAVFERVKAPGDSITSPHSILGAGGVSNTWKRLREICRPFFNQGKFEEANDRLTEHVINAVNNAIENAPEDGIDLFQLINRLVVEAHLLTMLGIDSIEPEGKNIPVRDYIDSDNVTSKCMADIIDESLEVKLAEPKFSSVAFAPMMAWLTDRLMLPPEQLGGIEKILAEAQRKGELSSMERLHNCVMYMIALAPSPATFWTILHVFKGKENYIDNIRTEADSGEFSTLCKCVKETLRMYAPVPIMVVRYVRKLAVDGRKSDSCPASLLQGHDKQELKDGDRVIIPTIILQNDPYLWKDPNRYDPERFDAPDNLKKVSSLLLRGSGVQARPKQKSSRSLDNKARYFPFGQGKHTCLGQPYASWLTVTICSTIFSNFDMEIEDVDGLLEKKCSYQRVKDHVYTFPKGTFKAKVKSLDISDTLHLSLSKKRVENLKTSMILNMPNFSEFLQETDMDDYSSSRSSTNSINSSSNRNSTARFSGRGPSASFARNNPKLENEVMEEEDDGEKEDW